MRFKVEEQKADMVKMREELVLLRRQLDGREEQEDVKNEAFVANSGPSGATTDAAAIHQGKTSTTPLLLSSHTTTSPSCSPFYYHATH